MYHKISAAAPWLTEVGEHEVGLLFISYPHSQRAETTETIENDKYF